MKFKWIHINLILLFVTALSIGSCVQIFKPDLSIGDSVEILVVEGKITDEIGPFKVKLSNSVSVYTDPNLLDNVQPVLDAEVQIYDDKGNNYTLFEKEGGWYETSDKKLQGEIGNTYVLSIRLSNGLVYESSPELMLDVPEVDKVHYIEKEQIVFKDNEPTKENHLSILVDSKVVEGVIGYFKWEFKETWEFEMPSYVEVNHGMGQGAPPPSMELVDIEPLRKYCWANANERSILVSSTINNSENRIKDFVLQTISPTDDKLNKRYSILVKQYALSRDLYNYFKKLHESNEEKGGMYDRTPSHITGNIQCCYGVVNALGYFFASSVKTKRIFIDRSDHSIAEGSGYPDCGWTTDKPFGQPVYLYGTNERWGNIYSTDKYCTDCRLRGTKIKPDFWE